MLSTIKTIFAAILVGLGVAATFLVFETSVRIASSFIWDELFNTTSNRLLIFPIIAVTSLAFFGLQHYWDKSSENDTTHALGATPTFTPKNYIKTLVIGFLSLVAGVSLGPEGILIPASLVLGGVIGKKLDNSSDKLSSQLATAGFIALFVAFFSSLPAALVGIFLLMQDKSRTKLTISTLSLATVASVSTYALISAVGPESYVSTPSELHVSPVSVAVVLALFFAGYTYSYALMYVSRFVAYLQRVIDKNSWYTKALVASLGLATIYLVGGPLIQFTGNASIAPMFEQATTLSLGSLVLLAATKTIAIAWSKTLGYRGGMIFPTLFVAAVFVAIAQSYEVGLSINVGMITVMIGVFIANSKTHSIA